MTSLSLIKEQVIREIQPDFYVYRLISSGKSKWVEPSNSELVKLAYRGYIHYTVEWYSPVDGSEVYRDFIVELDYDDLKSNLKAAREITKYLYTLGIYPIAVFSGNKSIHLRVDLSLQHYDLIVFWDKIREALGNVIDVLAKRYLIDVAVFKSTRHLVRAIGSKHEETKLYCIPINLTWNEKEIIKKAYLPPKYIPRSRIDIGTLIDKAGLIKISRDIEKRLVRKKARKIKAYKRSHKIHGKYQWVEEVLRIEGLEDGRKRTLFRIIIPYLANVKKLDDEEILKIVKGWVSKQKSEGKIYDSWMRSAIKSARNADFKPIPLPVIKRIDPEHYQLLAKHLGDFQ